MSIMKIYFRLLFLQRKYRLKWFHIDSTLLRMRFFSNINYGCKPCLRIGQSKNNFSVIFLNAHTQKKEFIIVTLSNKYFFRYVRNFYWRLYFTFMFNYETWYTTWNVGKTDPNCMHSNMCSGILKYVHFMHYNQIFENLFRYHLKILLLIVWRRKNLLKYTL